MNGLINNESNRREQWPRLPDGESVTADMKVPAASVSVPVSIFSFRASITKNPFSDLVSLRKRKVIGNSSSPSQDWTTGQSLDPGSWILDLSVKINHSAISWRKQGESRQTWKVSYFQLAVWSLHVTSANCWCYCSGFRGGARGGHQAQWSRGLWTKSLCQTSK